MGKYVAVCEIHYSKDDGIPYAHHYHESIGPFESEQEASEFMVRNIQNQELLKRCLSRHSNREVSELDHWEVVELLDPKEIIG